MILPEKLRTHFSSWLEQSGELFGVPFGDDTTSVPEHFFYAGNSSVKRAFLDEAGAFDERFQYHAWDDFELGRRLGKLGLKAAFLPEARAEHFHAISLADRCRTMMQAGEAASVFEQIYPGKYAWHRKCRVPPWCFRCYGLACAVLHALLRGERYLIRSYRARLDASFVAGYRQAMSKGG
jgi:GT2 family glycosyltransferase